MHTLPDEIIALMMPFAQVFDKRTWVKAQILLIGAILVPGKRTVTAALRVMGLSDELNFGKYHHVLNRAVWSPRALSRILLDLLLRYIDQGKHPLVFGIDETIERRWGPRIRARGIYRDPVRSSRSHFVKTSGLRWISLMWLAPIAWAERIWALPVLTVLAPSERYYAESKRQAKQVLDWARQMVFQLRRWLPHRYLALVADSTYAALDFLSACQSLANPVTVITRLRLDAALYAPALPRQPGQLGRPRKKGKRLPSLLQHLSNPNTVWSIVTVAWYEGAQRTLEIASNTCVWYHPGKPVVPIRWVLIRDPLGEFEPLALLSTDQALEPTQIVEWFVQRWQLEVTFEELRAHLGVETQRQWSDLAIARTTPALFGLFSLITLVAHALQSDTPIPFRTDAWYHKPLPTFSDAIALVRRHLWPYSDHFSMSDSAPDVRKFSDSLVIRLLDTLCYAA